MLAINGFRLPVRTAKAIFGNKYDNLLQSLKVTHTPKIGAPTIVKLYEYSKDNGIVNLVLPRSYVHVLSRACTITHDFPGPHMINNLVMSSALFNNQLLVVEHISNELTTRGTSILNMKAGLGKTFVAGGIINKLRVKTLYIVPKRPLMVQCIKDLRGMFYTENTSGNTGGNTIINKFVSMEHNANDDVTVMVINSALNQPPAFFARYSFCVMDEIHTYCSSKRREIFRRASLQYVLGMSATTQHRKDGFDVIYTKEFGQPIMACDLPGWEINEVSFRTDVDVIYYNGPPEYTNVLCHESTGKIFTPYMHKQTAGDPYRNAFVVKEINELYMQGHSIYVFAEERSMLVELAKLIANMPGLKSDDNSVNIASVTNDPVTKDSVTKDQVIPYGQFVGGLTDDEITIMAKRPILLTTYGYGSTGVSIIKQTAIVFYTSRRSGMEQILARILRRGSDPNIVRRVKDIVDNKTPMRYQLTDRLIAYEFYEMNVQYHKVKYTDIVM